MTRQKRNNKRYSFYFADKVDLRIRHLPSKKKISVLDCFAGAGQIWKAIDGELDDIELSILFVDREHSVRKCDFSRYIISNNLKILSQFNIHAYDVIDLDAYGIPIEQLRLLFKRRYRGIVFVTFIQTGLGSLPYRMLLDLGFSKDSIRNGMGVFSYRGQDLFFDWLGSNGLKRVIYRRAPNKQSSRILYCYLDFGTISE